MKIGGQQVPLTTIVLASSEGLLIGGSLFLASVFRLWAGPHSWQKITEPGALIRLGLVIVVCELALYYYDLYDFQIVSRRAVLFVRLLQSLGAACLVLAVLYYWQPQLSLGRGIAALAAPAIVLIILSWRLLLDASAPLLRRSEKVLVLGTGNSGIELAREIIVRPEFNLTVSGFLDENGENFDTSLVNPGIIGAAADVEAIVERDKINRVVVSLSERRGRMPITQLLRLKLRGVRIEDAHTCFERLTGKIVLQHLTPSWLILNEGFRNSQLLLAVKRGMDIIVSALSLIIASPVMLLVAIAILIESGWPILFLQKRVGSGGREFNILKFRSMQQSSDDHPPSWTRQADQRITRVGKFIRKYRLDELPQIVNVLLGHMSIVGPRPEQPYFCQLLEESIPYYNLRHCVRPGITGWAQVKYQYGASIEETKTKLEYDLFYVKHLSFLLDLAIIFETWKVLLSGRGAK